MRKTPGKSKAVLVTCLLLLFIFTMPAMAWPPPCPGCCYWDGYTCWPDNSACAPCNSCISCECEWDCITGATCCNGSCCDSGNCCNSTTCCSNSDDVCCTDSNSYCCQSGKTCCQGTCCDPSLCQDCNSTTGQCESICDPNTESCCDGTCCNTSTQKCCDDIGGDDDGYCCPDDYTCCDGACCDPNLCQDCVDGSCQDRCVDPNTCFQCDGAGNCEYLCDPNMCEDCNDGVCEDIGCDCDIEGPWHNMLVGSETDECGNTLTLTDTSGSYCYYYNGLKVGNCPYKYGVTSNSILYWETINEKRFYQTYHKSMDCHNDGSVNDEGTKHKYDSVRWMYDCISDSGTPTKTGMEHPTVMGGDDGTGSDFEELSCPSI